MAQLKFDEIHKLNETFFSEMNLRKEQILERIELADLLTDVFLYLFTYIEGQIAIGLYDPKETKEIVSRRYKDSLEDYGISLEKYPHVDEYVDRIADKLVDSTKNIIGSQDKKDVKQLTLPTKNIGKSVKIVLDKDTTKSTNKSENKSENKSTDRSARQSKKSEETQDRAIDVAENESNTVFSIIEHDDAVRDGKTTKRWITEQDEKVRHTHREVDFMEIPIDEPFTVGDSLLLFPRDDSLGANPRELIRCRCSLIYE